MTVLNDLSTLDQSVTLTANDLVQEMTTFSHKNLLAACSLLTSQTQDFLNNHLVRVSITPIKQRTMETRDEVLLSVVAQHMNTNGYQVSDLEYIEFYRADPDLSMDAVFRSVVDAPFLPAPLPVLRWVQCLETRF